MAYLWMVESTLGQLSADRRTLGGPRFRAIFDAWPDLMAILGIKENQNIIGT